MQVLSLNGRWKVTYLPHQASIENILTEHYIPEGWLDAEVPEEIHATLRKHGLIQGHVYGKDLGEETWIEEVDWIYYKEIFVEEKFASQDVRLEFEGLDTLCDIYLNGNKIGSSRNMYKPAAIDVSKRLLFGGRNVLVVRFFSPVKAVEGEDTAGLFSTTTKDRLMVRKAQMNYSWDFCGRCVTAGIWKGVQILSYDHVYMESYYLYTKSISEEAAVLGLEVQLNASSGIAEDCTVEVEFSFGGERVFHYSVNADESRALELHIPNPQLWWPRPYGAPALYDVRLLLRKNGQTVDVKTQRFGIRTVEIIQEDQEDGKSFIFAVNGKRLFIRGANWVPIRAVYTDIRDEEYVELLDYAVEGNLSMLRIWGGGIYEPDLFFELCDERGIMVWEDFMFACGVYPQHEEFLANVYEEAVYVLKKYRNFTSLVLWSGDNENDEAYGWDMRPYGFFHDKVNRVTLKSAWETYDPKRLYIPSSPYSPFEDYKGGDNPKSPHQGDMHIYIISADPSARDYYKKVKGFRPRFMSEFGFISLPEKDTFFKFNFYKKELESFDQLKSILPGLDLYTEGPDQQEQLIYHSQVYNSYALKYWIEYLRSLKWTCAGSLYWKFNDPVADNNKGMIFPTLMSTVDFYKRPKMTYYFTKRAYEDVILTADEFNEGFRIYSCSELSEDLPGRLTVELLNFDGQVLHRKVRECVLPKDSSTLLDTVYLTELPLRDPYREYMKITFEDGKQVLENRYFLVDIGEFHKLKLEKAAVVVKDIMKTGDTLQVTLQADRYARSVRLYIPDQKADYSDNYFDMDAGSEVTIRVKVKQAESLKEQVLSIEGQNMDRKSYPLYRIV